MKSNKRDIFRRAVLLFAVSGLIGVLIILIVYSKTAFDVGVRCPFKEIFNWDCPGCGGTRMAESMVHLHFYQAFRYNPFVFVTAPILAILYLWQSYLFVFKNQLIKWLDIFIIGYIVSFILFGILRNTEAFRWLAPTVVASL